MTNRPPRPPFPPGFNHLMWRFPPNQEELNGYLQLLNINKDDFLAQINLPPEEEVEEDAEEAAYRRELYWDSLGWEV